MATDHGSKNQEVTTDATMDVDGPMETQHDTNNDELMMIMILMTRIWQKDKITTTR
jgi:hypothetical protein